MIVVDVKSFCSEGEGFSLMEGSDDEGNVRRWRRTANL